MSDDPQWKGTIETRVRSLETDHAVQATHYIAIRERLERIEKAINDERQRSEDERKQARQLGNRVLMGIGLTALGFFVNWLLSGRFQP